MNHRRSRAEIKLPWPVNAAAGLFVMWAIVYSIRNRTFDDFIRYPLYAAVPIVIVAALALLAIWWRSGFRRPEVEELITMLLVPLGIWLASTMYYAIGAAIKDAYLWMRMASTSKESAVVIGITVTAALAGLLFYFRLILRSCYGLTETLVGLAIAGDRIAAQTSASYSSQFYLAVLTAGVYLIVRGLDNIHQGLTKKPYDPVATRTVTWVKNFSRTASGGQGVLPGVAQP